YHSYHRQCVVVSAERGNPPGVSGGEPEIFRLHQQAAGFRQRAGGGGGYQAVRLPYQGGDLAMYVFLTDTNYSPETLVQNLDAENWRRVTSVGFSDHDGLVVLPKFKLENTFDLKPPLQKLGLKTAFNQDLADFTGM